VRRAQGARGPRAAAQARPGAGFRPFRPPDAEIRGRLERAHAALRGAGFDGLLAFASFLAKDGHVCYLTNHKITNAPWSFNERNNGFGFAAVVLPVGGSPILLPGTRFDARAVSPVVRDVRPGFDLARLLQDALRDAGLVRSRVALAGSDVMPVYYGERLARELPGVRLAAADDLVEGLRVVKSPFEVEVLEAAALVCDAGLEAAWRASHAGATEIEIANAAYVASMEAGADRVDRVRVRAGREMVAWGRWPLATTNRVRAGDLVYIDFVGWYHNYVWDEARCWAVSRPSAWQRALLEEGALLTDRMRETARPGVPVGEWVRDTVEHFRRRRFGRALSIVGHGVGLEVVENPWFEQEVATPLVAGMVLCLESGFVLPGKAFVRVEREIVVEEGGARFLGRFRSRLW
jgi:Xaa-Pro aminopeptidase